MAVILLTLAQLKSRSGSADVGLVRMSLSRLPPTSPGRGASPFAKRSRGGVDTAKQKKQLVVLAGALAVLAFIWLRGRGPAAADATVDQAITPGQTFETSGGTIHIPPIAHSARLVAEWRREPIPHLTRNLFRSDLTAQPAPIVAEPTVPIRPTGPTGQFWQALERSLANRAEQSRQRDQAIDSFMSDVRQLRISSILTGAAPRVLIGSELLAPGDAFGAGTPRLSDRLTGPLRVERITPEGVEVGRGVLRAWLPTSNEPPHRLENAA